MAEYETQVKGKTQQLHLMIVHTDVLRGQPFQPSLTWLGSHGFRHGGALCLEKKMGGGERITKPVSR